MKQTNTDMKHETVQNSYLQTTLIKGVSIVAAAFLAGLGGGTFTAIRVLGADHFTTISNTNRISALEEGRKELLTKEVFEARMNPISKSIDDIVRLHQKP